MMRHCSDPKALYINMKCFISYFAFHIYEPFSITFEELPITCMLFQECLSKRAYLVWSTLSHNIQTIFIICDVKKNVIRDHIKF